MGSGLGLWLGLLLAMKASSSARFLRMMAMFLDSIASLARSAMIACSSLARDGEAVPKYCTSTSRCLRPRSWKAIQPMVMPQPPHGLERAPTLSPLS